MSARCRSTSAPGFPPWCRGGRPKKATSPKTSSAGTSVLPVECPARSWSRRPASATCRAAPSCASVTTASCPACGRWSRRCGGPVRAARGSYPTHRFPRHPSPARSEEFFERFLDITDRHRAALGEPGLSDAEIRARLSVMSGDDLAGVLTAGEMEALQFGYRERVTDMRSSAHRESAAGAAGFVRRRGRSRGGGRLRRRRAALRACLYDGVVSLAHQHAPDGYGGARENRARLPLEVLTDVRGRVGKTCRWLPLSGGRMHRRRQ